MNIKTSLQKISLTKALLIGGVLFAGYFIFFNSGDEKVVAEKEVQFLTIEKSDISKTIKVQGTAEIVDEQKLRFNQSGKITAVHMNAGDTVQKDNLIAEIDKADVYSEIEQAEISLTNSRLSLQELLDGNTQSQILKAKNSITQIEQDIAQAEKDLALARDEEKNTLQDIENTIDQAKKTQEDKYQLLVTAEKDLEHTQTLEEDSVENSKTSYDTTLEKYILTVKNDLVEIDSTMKKIDAIVGVEDSTKKNNDEYEVYLGFSDINSYNKAKNTYQKARQNILEFEKTYAAMQTAGIWTEENIAELLATEKETFILLGEATDATYAMLDASITAPTLSRNTLDGFLSSISGAQSSTQKKITTLAEDITNIKNIEETELTELKSSNAVRKKEDSVRTAESALQKAQDALETLENDKNIKIENARLAVEKKENSFENIKKSLEVSRLDLIDLQDGASREKISIARNTVKQKELSLAKVQQNIEKYELTAPFDGVLRKIDFQVGDNLLADDDKYVYVENPDLLKVTILLDQIDIVKIQEGFPVRITFDSYPEKTFTGSIEEIDQTPITQSGVVSYEASITLQKGEEMLFSGMTASIEVIIAEKKDILVVPNLSIQTRKGKTFVQKMVNGEKKMIAVETGITDGKKTEIISGLSEGEEIIKVQYSSSSSSEGEEGMKNLMRASGGGRQR